ncbi:hypothetical protein ANO11243_004670 [Dothideomycetidae sp. 11243]|nr:hypothetical protein ANO11243_004670 [fungal sp. No.11243]
MEGLPHLAGASTKPTDRSQAYQNSNIRFSLGAVSALARERSHMAALGKRTFDEYTHDAVASSGTTTRHMTPATVPISDIVVNGHTDSSNVSNAGSGRFKPTATIVLIGIRGTGKSSLAFLAATAYSRRVIEYEREFHSRTSETLTAHRQNEQNRAGRKKRQDTLLQTLTENDEGAVIVCDFSALEYGSNIFLSYAQHHPVIYVDRDDQGIHQYLNWDANSVSHLSSSSAQLLRACSNYEFFNWTETEHEAHGATTVSAYVNAKSNGGDEATSLPFLKLKRTERDFLKFLRLILGDHARAPSQQSAYPLSDLPLHSRRFTYAAAITVDEILNGDRDLEIFQTGADAIRLRVPGLSKHRDERRGQLSKLAHAFSVVRRATILPLVLDPCLIEPTESKDYSDIWGACCRLAPEYVTLDLNVKGADVTLLAKARGNISVVGVAEVSDWESGQAEGFHRQASSIGCDGIVITSISNPQDTLASSLQSFRARATKQQNIQGTNAILSTFNTGNSGRFSQYTNPGVLVVRGAGPGIANTDVDLRCSNLTAQDATRALFHSFVYAPLNFCIVGANVDFSLSPALHNASYGVLGMPHMYSTKSSPTLGILDELKADHSFGGAAITQPYKIDVVKRLDSLSRHAEVIRAVNTVLPMRHTSSHDRHITDLDIVTTRNQQGPVLALHGDNTDWIGMRACLRRGLSPINAVRKTSVGLVIGAGGMARAGVYAMIHMGVQQIFICNRTLSRAEELAAYFNSWLSSRDSSNNGDDKNGASSTPEVLVLPTLTSEWPKGYRLPTMIISSVPAEVVNGQLEANFTLPTGLLGSPSGGVVIELTYKPLVTALVRQVIEQASRGWCIMTGLDMLPEQAFAQFELFTGRRAPRHVMRAEILKDFQRQREKS